MNPLRPFAHLSDAELDDLIAHGDLDSAAIANIALEQMAREGKIYDSGERQDGEIVWKARPPAVS